MQYWDKLVRVTHWSVALGFLINRFEITSPGSQIHRLVGITVITLVLLRLIWGLTFAKGPARLSSIIPTFSAISTHIKEVRQRTAHQQLGHNPIGMLFIWAIWGCLICIGFTGWAQDTTIINRWPVDEWHQLLVNLATVLVCVHIIAVISMSLWLKHNLLTAMLFIKKD